jgi:large subunit ribosomal protein L18
MIKEKYLIRQTRKAKIRKSILSKIRGTSERPRVMIIKSNKYIYAQVIDDSQGKVIAGATTASKDLRENLKGFKGQDAAKELGKKIAELLTAKEIKSAVLDRNFYAYIGKVKVFADAMRENGIKL